jgi:hypothetical protein
VVENRARPYNHGEEVDTPKLGWGALLLLVLLLSFPYLLSVLDNVVYLLEQHTLHVCSGLFCRSTVVFLVLLVVMLSYT